MPQFRNKSTGAVITANGPVAKDYSQRKQWEEVKPATGKASDGSAGDLSDMTVAELKSYADQHHIDLAGASKKDDIVAAIQKESDQ